MMIVGWICGGMLGLAALMTAAYVIRSTSLPDRSIGIDMLVALFLNGLAIAAAVNQDGLFAPIILLLGLLGFLGTVTIARYIERRGL